MKKLNVGDRVKMVRPSCYSFDKVGNTGKITSAYDGLLLVEVDGQRNPKYGDWSYFESAGNWEVIEEESKMTKFKVGDKVVIKDNFHGHGFQMGDVVVISKLMFEGYEGHKVGDNPKECWVFDDSEIEEYKEEVKVQKFKIADKVRMVKLRSDGLSYSFDKIGNEGVVKDVILELIKVDVQCKGNTWEGNGWTYPLDNRCWELVQNEKPKATVLKLGDYKIVFNGDTTVVTDGTRKGVAKRHPDDEYDAVVGLQVALERFNGGTRKPKIGDKVRVLKVDDGSRYGRHGYPEGQIVEVVGYGHKDTDIICMNKNDFRQTLIAGEYEVLG